MLSSSNQALVHAAPWHAEALKRGYASCIALPLKSEDQVLGALTIYAGETDVFDAREVGLLKELANDLAYGIVSLRAAQKLRLRERAIESSSNGIMITDVSLEDNPIIYVNSAFERITGYTAAEVIGRNGRFLVGNDADQLELEKIRAALRERREGRALLRNYRKDGTLFWNDLSLAPIRNEQGHVTHYVSIINYVTESMVMHNADTATLHDLKAIGTRISLDDFGTGYSSLSYLNRFPIDNLKIDRSFVRDITTSSQDAAIVAAVIALAHSPQLKVIAEGVETEAQLDYLHAHRCDEIQGYYFSPPVLAEEFPRC